MTTGTNFLPAYNCAAVALDALPCLPFDEFRRALLRQTASGAAVSAFLGVPAGRLGDASGALRLLAVLSRPEAGLLLLGSANVSGSYPAMTPDCPALHEFEREVAEQWGVVPEGHPWLKPVRFPPGPGPKVGLANFFEVEGSEIHEVAVGPVHAGIIEPGHFRFQCYGEQVYHLEISLGYQHRGVEAALLRGPEHRRLHCVETLAGDSTLGHATAHCQALEALSGCPVPPRADAIRGVCLELERLANHCGDLGALAGDVGFLPTASYCGRLRGDFLNLTALVCGNRFGRGAVVPGGVGFDLEPDRARKLAQRLGKTAKDAAGAIALLWNTPSVLARFENVGVLSRKACLDLGLVGPAARASELVCDVRSDFPTGAFRFTQIPVSACQTGDVFARAFVRWLEMERSCEFIQAQLAALPDSPLLAPLLELRPSHLAVSLAEGWRGEICHVAITGPDARLAHYKVVDPSFHNWIGLALALRGQQISDFPLCNKSFNLSYCGHDL